MQEKHPDKTFIGWIHKGFDFLGYYFDGLFLRPAKVIVVKMLEKLSQLYEQKTLPHKRERLAEYLKRWRQWMTGKVPLSVAAPSNMQLYISRHTPRHHHRNL